MPERARYMARNPLPGRPTPGYFRATRRGWIDGSVTAPDGEVSPSRATGTRPLVVVSSERESGPMSTGTALRVMVVDDQPPIRRLVSLLLSRASDFEVRAPALEGWFEDVCETRPDILLLDLALGNVDAVPFIPKVVARCPETMVAALTSRPAEDGEASVLASGAFVFYEKDHISRLAHDLRQDHRMFLRALAGQDVLAPSALAREVAVTTPSLDARGGTGRLPVGRSSRGRAGGRSTARDSKPSLPGPTGR